MMSLSKEWSLLSRELYGPEFVDELAEFLQKHRVRTILECGCGDGYVLQGLAKKRFGGIGIDSDPEMIEFALANHSHPNISYEQMSWLDIGRLEGLFDAVICRGNSLPWVAGWGAHTKPKEAKPKIEESIRLFFQKLKKNGLLYVDSCSQREVDQNSGKFEINTPNIQLTGIIEYNLEKMERRVFGSGTVFKEKFSNDSTSYLLTPEALECIIQSCKPAYILHPKLVREENYDIICAIK